MKRFIIGPLVVALAWIAAPSSAFAAATITNGSFELGSYDMSGPWNTFFAGSPSVTGWTIESGSVDATFTNYWVASDGDVSIDLSGNSPGVISQAITTNVGTEYVVTFDLAGNLACGPNVKSMTVMATGGALATESFDFVSAGATPLDMKWSQREYTFVATSTSTVLTFASTTGSSCGPALDNVAIAETLPPPPPPPPPAETPTTTADCKDGGWQTLTDGDGNAFKNQGDCVSYVATKGRNVASTAARHPAGDRHATALSRRAGDAAPKAAPTKHGHTDRHPDRQPKTHAADAASKDKAKGGH